MSDGSFLGYVREDGSVGTRNYVLVIPSVGCSSEVAARIASNVNGAVSLYFNSLYSCIEAPKGNVERAKTVLSGLAQNPNVASVLVVGLGCEGLPADELADDIAKSGKHVEAVVIQKQGGTINTIRRGTAIVSRMVEDASKLKRESVGVENLSVAVECGGSDTTSGLAANPATGVAVDKIINAGGTVIFSEVTELVGAEKLLAKRAVNSEVSDKIIRVIKATREVTKKMGKETMAKGNGNIEGGLTTVQEKALGFIYKTGSAPIQDVLDYGEKPEKKGLFLMNTPGQDIESITGMVAGGRSQVVLFTTGRGNAIGFPIAPVIKICGNPRTVELMKDNIDVNVATIIEGKETIEEAGERLFNYILEVASGELVSAERFGFREIAITNVYQYV